MPTEQFELNFGRKSSESEIPESESEPKVARKKEKKKKKSTPEEKSPQFGRISEQERIDDQPRYGH